MVQSCEVVKDTRTNVKIKRDSCGATQENRSKPFSFLQIIFTTRRALYDVPRQSIAFVLEQEWNLERTKFLSFVRLGLGPEIRNAFVTPPSYGQSHKVQYLCMAYLVLT